jgi:pimeloyl-ACP methyl ester carboxylesterase
MSMKLGLVLVPGLLCDEALWAPQVRALSDLADCWIPESLTENTMEGMAKKVLRDAPFERFALAGLSMGGYVCMQIMRQAPQRVLALALLDTRAVADTPEETQRRNDLVRLAQTARGFQPVTRRMLPLLVHPSRMDDAPLVDVVRAMAERTGVEGFVRQQQAIIGRADSRNVLKQVDVPSLVLCGRDDMLTPLVHHEQMAQTIPGARLVVIEQCGHVSSLERSDEVNEAMRAWLKRI